MIGSCHATAQGDDLAPAGDASSGEDAVTDAGLVAGGSTPATSANIGAGIRMATFNAQFLPSKFAAGTLEENGDHLVERIIAADYDFIVLNEVFDADLQEILTDGLAERYPYYVEYLDAGDLEDSGLALYSKFAFDPLPEPVFAIDPRDCEASGATIHVVPADPNTVPYDYDQDCESVGFIEFDACNDDDCFASKGVGLVRLHHPVTGESINVLFTHTQASYIPAGHPHEQAEIADAKDWFSTRDAQLDDAERLLRGSIGDSAVDRELVFMLGDLNIDGDLVDPDYGDNYTVYNIENLHEWVYQFANAGSFFTDVLHDAWAFENAPVDPSGHFDRGITNVTAWGGQSDGARLDYILTKPSAGCAQHMTLARNLDWGAPYIETGMGPAGIGSGGTDEISDHVGVNLDWNVRTTACSPATAVLLDPAPGQLHQVTRTLDQPGTMKWFRFDEPGTYSFELQTSSGAEFRVYEAIDLTTPVVNYKAETTELHFRRDDFVGKEFRISSAPFYVRVFHPDRTQTNVEFTLRTVQHDCLTIDTACALRPGDALAHDLPANPTGGLGNEAWFELCTEATPQDLTQDLTFFVHGIRDTATDGGFQLELVDADGVAIDSDEILEPASGGVGLAIRKYERHEIKQYLRLTRSPPMSAPYPSRYNHFAIGWTTDLSIFFGSAQGGQSLQLRCLEENDGVDLDYDDEMWLAFVKLGASEIVSATFIGDFDAGNKAPMDAMLGGPIYFTDADPLVLHFYEDDDFLNGDNDEYERSIATLDRATAGPVAETFVFEPGGSGLYQFRYNLTHGFDE
ncbi:MAG: endonuclease/exonuclease/phosphatase family protein [Deltaproteobacteria bacterium]|nr:endonuclease/exonuclease/phosphatase family protein [Deltaproteobacteria bacterium]